MLEFAGVMYLVEMDANTALPILSEICSRLLAASRCGHDNVRTVVLYLLVVLDRLEVRDEH